MKVMVMANLGIRDQGSVHGASKTRQRRGKKTGEDIFRQLRMKLPKFEKYSKKKGPATALRFPAVAPCPKQGTARGSVGPEGHSMCCR